MAVLLRLSDWQPAPDMTAAEALSGSKALGVPRRSTELAERRMRALVG